MPPKPLAEDLARKKAEREKAEKAQKALAILEKPRGYEAVVDLAMDPVGTAKGLAREAKRNFYDPIKGLGDAFNPFIKQKPIDRVNKALGGALTAADLVTPFVPEGTIVNSLRREAMERVLDDEVARYAASGGGAKYRGVLGIHGGPKGLTSIEPLTNYNTPVGRDIAWFWDVKANEFDPERIAGAVLPYAGNDGAVYVARFPESAVAAPDFSMQRGSAIPNYSTEAGQILASMPRKAQGARQSEQDLAQMLFNAPLKPAERRQLQAALRAKLAQQKMRGGSAAASYGPDGDEIIA